MAGQRYNLGALKRKDCIAPDEEVDTLHGSLCHRCINVCERVNVKCCRARLVIGRRVELLASSGLVRIWIKYLYHVVMVCLCL